MVRIPSNREPTHPGVMLQKEFLEPLGISQSKLAEGIRVPFQRVNEIVRGRRGITPSTALRLSKFLGTSPGFWMNLQLRCDLHSAKESESTQLENIRPHDWAIAPSLIEERPSSAAKSSQGAFDAFEYVAQVGFDLVSEIGEWKKGVESGLIVSSSELESRRKFERLLPSGIRVGSGYVIDSFGNSSKPMDIVLYEADLHPIFEVAGDPPSTYFPCEGVIAVGGINPRLDSIQLVDIFDEISSVKCLRRHMPSTLAKAWESNDPPDPSPQLPGGEIAQIPDDPIWQLGWQGQTFGFALAGSSNLPIESIGKEIADLTEETGSNLSPDVLVALDGSIVFSTPNLSKQSENVTEKMGEAELGIYSVKYPEKSFAFLLSMLHDACTEFRISQAFDEVDRYFFEDGAIHLPSDGIVTPLRSAID